MGGDLKDAADAGSSQPADAGRMHAAPVHVPDLGPRIRQLRLARGWSQEELGARLGVGQKQISAYERQVNLPSTEVLLRMAAVFGITLDGLVFATGQPMTEQPIADRELLDLATAVDRLGVAERTFAKEALELLVMRARVRSMVGGRSGGESEATAGGAGAGG